MPCARACARGSAAAPTTSAGARGLFAPRAGSMWTRRVQLVRRDGRDVSTLYGRGGGGLFAAGGLGAEPPRSGVGVCGRFTALMSTRRARRHVQRPGGHVSSRPASVSGTLSSARTAPSATANSSKSICEVSASAVPAPPASRFAPRKARIACKGGGGGRGAQRRGAAGGVVAVAVVVISFRTAVGHTGGETGARGDERRTDSAVRCRGAGTGAGEAVALVRRVVSD